jgi:hypothetical protein
VSNSE